MELYPSRQGLAEGGGGQGSRRSIRTREEQDAPWRIRVRSAVRLLRREPCPPPPRHRSLTPLFAESRSPGDAKLSLNTSRQPLARALERRAGQDAPWRIRVRSAVRLLRREPCLSTGGYNRWICIIEAPNVGRLGGTALAMTTASPRIASPAPTSVWATLAIISSVDSKGFATRREVTPQ